MKYDRVKKNPPRLLNLTGFTLEEFDSLLPTFKYDREEYYSQYTLKGKLRERIYITSATMNSLGKSGNGHPIFLHLLFDY